MYKTEHRYQYCVAADKDLKNGSSETSTDTKHVLIQHTVRRQVQVLRTPPRLLHRALAPKPVSLHEARRSGPCLRDSRLEFDSSGVCARSGVYRLTASSSSANPGIGPEFGRKGPKISTVGNGNRVHRHHNLVSSNVRDRPEGLFDHSYNILLRMCLRFP